MPDLLATINVVRHDGRTRNVRCPLHDDRRASLSISRGADARALMHCHAGCATETIIEAAGLTMADLFEPHANGNGKRSLAATFDYTDEQGTLLYQVVRFAPKDFRQRRPDGTKGGWVWNLGKVRRVLFGLPELCGQRVAYVVEGEKDVLTLRKLRLVATTNAGGAGKWRDDYAQQLRDAGVESVVILPDNDDPGRAHAEAIARSCHGAGLMKVKIVALPDLPSKGDVSDWLAGGRTRDDLIARVKATALYEAPEPAGAPPDAVEFTGDDPPVAATIELTAIGDLLAEPDEAVDFLVADRIAFGSVNIFAGKPKAGKSTSARCLALEVARGGSWLGFDCLPRSVWYLALEDKRSEVRSHFRRMGATGTEPVRFLFRQPANDLLGRLHALATREHPGLIIVDTLQRLIKADDLNDYAEVTNKLTPILTLARETGAAVLLVHHAGKSERTGLDSVLGSTALTGSVDNVFVLSRTERYRVLSSVQRIGPDLPETVITLTDTGQVDAGPSRHDADVAAVQRDFLATLGSGSLTRAALLEQVEARHQLKLEALRRAVDLGTIIRSGAGSKTDPHRFRLPGDSDSGSQVPAYTREPESSLSLFAENSNGSKADSSSQVPTIPEVPTKTRIEPELAAACCEGGALQLKCKLCRRSQTYWQRAEAVQ